MSKVIQMIKVSDIASIFLTNFNQETKELSFRTSYEPEYLQKENIEIFGDSVKTNLYHFHISYLNKFIHER